MPTTFRQDLRAALVAVLTEFRVENPGLLRAVHAARPESLGELPAAYVGSFAETITHTAGTRERAMRPSVLVVDTLEENAETARRLDVLVDLLVDRFTANVRRIGTSIIEPVSVTDGELAVGDAFYRTVEIGFDRTSIREGRS
jgi:hypothetical protein